MAKKYTIRYSGYSVEMSKPSSTVLVYKIPYRDLKLKNYGFDIPNQFIVYILFGKNDEGKDVVYVGKSKNGLASRPTSHNDKYDKWSTCFVLTQFKERTFFNDGTIQYLEDKLNKHINNLGTFQNTTEMTATGTANKSDEEDCDEYLKEAFDMLYILGLDLYTTGIIADEVPVEVIDVDKDEKNQDMIGIPDGMFYMKRKLRRNKKKPLNACMYVKDGKYIVKAGSEICTTDAKKGLSASIQELRHSDYVKDGVLQKDIIFNSPSSAACFVIGGSSNGWLDWRTDTEVPIDAFRTMYKKE